jgi:aldehyde dehydrogenase (NAD+)
MKLDEKTAVGRYLQVKGLLIGGDWRRSGSGGTQVIVSPASGRPIGEFPLAGEAEVDEAVKAARQAFPAWREMPANERQAILFRLADLLVAHQEQFTYIAALENGIPIAGGGGVDLATRWLRYYAGWCDKIEGGYARTYPIRGLDYITKVPYGVVGIITTWNMPLISTFMKISPAMAAGNCVVMKPTEFTVYSQQLIGDLALEAGLPPGALNVIPGGPEAGASLVGHPGISKVSFTGGDHTARRIMAQAAENLTPVMFELGGKSANILFGDANLDAAVPLGFMSAMGLCGQGCVNPMRILAHRSIHDDVVRRLVALATSYRVGDPLDPETQAGPVIHEAACKRILGVIADAVACKSGTLECGGERLGGALASGAFISPAVFSNVDHNSSLAMKEIFGPVLTVGVFDTEEEAIALANGTNYGLGAYLSTADLNRAHRVANRMEAGYVSVNGVTGMSPNVPFGGMKSSGFGSEGGQAGLEEFLRPKNIFIAEGA